MKFPNKSIAPVIVSPLSHLINPPRTVFSKQQSWLFVPYWTIENEQIPSNYDGFIYFGIVPTAMGIDFSGDGYQKLPMFFSKVSSKKEKLLAVQMINNTVNEQVLQDYTLQKKIIDQSVQIANEYGFDGIVLDFEFSALPFPSITDKITKFISRFSQTTHSGNIKFFITVYGDVFYRLRPYNISDIAKQSDGFFIMAYDFHKANGDPGGNFPLKKDTIDDYDFSTMITDFLKQVPTSKLVITFGLFGYDWKVNDKGQSIAPATALSLSQIQKKIITSCVNLQCHAKRDNLSAEMQISYIDSQQIKHIVWFEDMESVHKKQLVMQAKGIGGSAFWAYTYF